jgi:hypothetical protein
MKIQELIDQLSEIRDIDPDKGVVIEVFDIKNSTITVGYTFEPIVHNAEDRVRIRPIKQTGHCVYQESTKDLKEIENGLCPPK